MRNFRQHFERFFLRLQAKIGERIKVIRLTTYFLGLAFAVYSSAVVEKYIGLMNELHVPLQYVMMTRSATRYFGYVVAFIIIVLVIQIIWVTADIMFGRKVPAPPPPDKEVKFTARPMEDHPNVEGLTGLAVEEFEGDTMRAEVVRGALESRSAIGLRIQNSAGQNIGFCDFYHLKKDAFQEWLEGSMRARLRSSTSNRSRRPKRATTPRSTSLSARCFSTPETNCTIFISRRWW
jgi:hypothetical protein